MHPFREPLNLNRNAGGAGDVVVEDVPPSVTANTAGTTATATRRPSLSQKAYNKARSAANFVAKDISGPKVPRPRFARAVCAEFFGTMFFVFAVAGSVVIPANLGLTSGGAADKAASLLVTAATQGLALAAMVSATGPMSGGHLNPAVTTSLMIVRTIPIARGFAYMFAQVLGAMCGAGLFKAVIEVDETGTLGATVPQVGSGQAWGMEFMITAVLIYTVLGTAVHGGANGIVKALAPLPIGFAVIAGVLIGGTVTGGSMNPARSFGPAVASGTWTRHWLYWLAPLSASLIVGLIYKAFFLSTTITHSQARRAGLLPSHNVMTTPESPVSADGQLHGGPAMRSAETIINMPTDGVVYRPEENLSEADLIAHTGEDEIEAIA
ncbi:hypothetical protein HDU87_001378 [Geranomyces variabilis]|uniref:Aquaporin n=1 Tax=Geranomyces variabilis TaxID=109894 RepID=A0AAD5XNZ7_9FUNG|nr:hypothetical protein HDU87_001378 [Geranomyces variabilis]